MNPRQYQSDAISKIESGWAEFSKQLIVLPTGSGKTIVAAHLTRREVERGGRVLFLAHREELLLQTLDKFSKACGLLAELEKAEFRASLMASVVVGSIQTFLSRAERWPADHFSLIIIDECHHSISASYQDVLKRFDATAKVLGVTATPDRGDKRNLGSYFENVAHEVQLFDLVNQKFLCPISIKSVPLQINLNGIKQTAGDYDSTQLGDALEPYMDSIAKAIVEHAPKRKTLVFLPLIATSQKFTDICVSHGLNARHIDGYSDDRKDILQSFARREFDVLCNAMLLTEGYDDPSIDCVIVLRPTRSRPLFSQMVGRGTRICEGKTDLLLLDFLWMHERHTLIRPAHLIAKSDEEAERITAKAEEKAESGKQEALDLQGLASETQVERESKLAEELALRAKKKSKSIDAMEFFLSLHQPDLAEYEPEMAWESEAVSPKQSELLDKFGFDVEGITCKGHASKIISKIFERRQLGLATPKQVKFLRKRNYAGAESATFKQASDFITRIAETWK